MIKDHYVTLGVAYDASSEVVKRSYKKLAKEFHPDVNAAPEAEKMFKNIAAAYEVLGDPEKRRQHDDELRRQAAGKPVYIRVFAPPASNVPDRRPLSPQLSQVRVVFELVEQDRTSMPQMRVWITNPNHNPSLRPVMRPTEGQHWWASLHADDKPAYFTISPKLSNIAPGVYGDSLDVHWEGTPALVASLDISLTVTPKPPAPPPTEGWNEVFTGPTTPLNRSAKGFNQPSVSAAYSQETSRRSAWLGGVLLLLLGILCLIGPPLLFQLSYFKGYDPNRDGPNPGAAYKAASILLIIVWLGCSPVCFSGAFGIFKNCGRQGKQ